MTDVKNQPLMSLGLPGWLTILLAGGISDVFAAEKLSAPDVPNVKIGDACRVTRKQLLNKGSNVGPVRVHRLEEALRVHGLQLAEEITSPTP